MTDSPGALLNDEGEVVVGLADGWTLRSGVYDRDDPAALASGEYVRLVDPDGNEYAYWDQDEWATDPALVMGAIINAAAGLRLEGPTQGERARVRQVERRAAADHAALIGKLIKAPSVVCSYEDLNLADVEFPEPLILRILDDDTDVVRWMDDDHLDPWYFVELVDAPPASRMVLADKHATPLAVYGPSYGLDGTYEKPAWTVLAPSTTARECESSGDE